MFLSEPVQGRSVSWKVLLHEIFIHICRMTGCSKIARMRNLCKMIDRIVIFLRGYIGFAGVYRIHYAFQYTFYRGLLDPSRILIHVLEGISDFLVDFFQQN